MWKSRWTRRRFLALTGKTSAGAVALGAAGYGGYRWPDRGDDEPAAKPAASPPPTKDVHRFASRDDLTPPQVTVTNRRPRSGGRQRLDPYVFLAPKGYNGDGPGTQGPLILDRKGAVVWFRPTPGDDSVPMDFRVQRYRGEPVLTWWQGRSQQGHGKGHGIILDRHYRQIATVQAGHGLQVDLHEFCLTPKGTALITAYRTADADLSSAGGPAKGRIFSGIVQEIDVATGKVLFSWDSADHIAFSESQTPPEDTKKSPWDYFHINSVAPAPDGDLIVSARNTCAIYKISRRNGAVVWRLGGKKSDFALPDEARFYWQHDARWHDGNRLSLFDDASSPPKEKESRGLILDVDPARKRVSVARQYTHPSRLLADNQGNTQLLAGGRVFVGWGAEPYFSEFDSDGTLIFDGRFPANDQSYRSYLGEWTGQPQTVPDLAVGENPARGVTVYASWNGATEIDRWDVLAGKTPGSLTRVARAPHGDFETAVAVADDGPYYAVVALNGNGHEIGRSKPVRRPA